jgi:ComF family protein
MDEDPPFREGSFGFYYEARLREAIHAFKFQGRKDVGRHLVNLLAHRLGRLGERCETIVPLPVTEKRLRERGFNQSFIIAEELSAMIGRPVLPSVLRKSRETEDQFTLSRKKRKANVRNAFFAERADGLKGRTVLLVDDLFTTGATAGEASRTLRKAGAAAVLLFCLARTP